MNSNSVRLARLLFMVVIFVPSTGFAQLLTIEQLRQQIFDKGQVDGEFVQCSIHGTSRIRRSGSFRLVPDNKLTLNFVLPREYSIEYSGDGTQTKIVGGIEISETNRSHVVSLMFSILNMEPVVLNRQFEVDLTGSVDKFWMVLIPEKRMAKHLNLIEIAGSAGKVESIDVKSRGDRSMIIHLLSSGKTSGATCAQ